MISQIDKKMEKLIKEKKLDDKKMKAYLGKLPENDSVLLNILKDMRTHVRKYGRKSDVLENYIKDVKQRIEQ